MMVSYLIMEITSEMFLENGILLLRNNTYVVYRANYNTVEQCYDTVLCTKEAESLKHLFCGRRKRNLSFFKLLGDS